MSLDVVGFAKQYIQDFLLNFDKEDQFKLLIAAIM